jgi:hypothetical protein
VAVEELVADLIPIVSEPIWIGQMNSRPKDTTELKYELMRLLTWPRSEMNRIFVHMNEKYGDSVRFTYNYLRAIGR